MASLSRIRRVFTSLRHSSSLLDYASSPRFIHHNPIPVAIRSPNSHLQGSKTVKKRGKWWNFSLGTVNLVISDGKPKFDTREIEPSRKVKCMWKKRLRMKRMRAKKKRIAANTKDPRRLTVKGAKRKTEFATAEERLQDKIEKTRYKEALLIERLKRYEVPKVHGPMVRPDELTREQKFYLKKMCQKASNYAQVGRRGIFVGVIRNMHLHWKKHETVKVYCKPCKPGQIQEYAQEIARLSGGILLKIIGDDTMIFYRGKNFVQPEVMSPIGTLSKRKALEKSKYEQSLEDTRHFIKLAEKELELYRRHVALYGNPPCKNSTNLPSDALEKGLEKSDNHTAAGLTDQEFSETVNELEEGCEWGGDCLSDEDDTGDEESQSADQELSEGETETEPEPLSGEDNICHLRAKGGFCSSE